MDREKINIRLTTLDDGPYLKKWLLQPSVLKGFPMYNEKEVDDSVRIWIGYSKLESSLTVEYDGQVCGLSTLYIQAYQKLKHTCLFSIILSEEYRGKGIGTVLLEKQMKYAKEKFNIEILHLEVYQDNPAVSLYKRHGFTEYALHKHFIKENGQYLAKLYMQKRL